MPAASSPSTPVNGQPAAPAAVTEPAGATPETSTPSAPVAAPPAAAAAPQEVERTNSIVVKNLPFQLKQEEFQEILVRVIIVEYRSIVCHCTDAPSAHIEHIRAEVHAPEVSPR